jgi:glycosyltransferase involved in cell wall biosynthesis
MGYMQRMAGAARSLLELLTNLPSSIQPLLLLPGEGRVSKAFREAGIEVEIVEPGPLLNQFGKAAMEWTVKDQLRIGAVEFLPYTLRIARLIRERRIDIVHANDPRGTLLVGAAAKLARRPLIAHLRGEATFGGLPYRLFNQLPDRIITVSQSIQESLNENGRAKAATVYNGTGDVSARGNLIPWLNYLREQGVVVVVCMASLQPFKGIHHLIRAVSQLNSRGWREKAVFLCVGDFYPEYPWYHEYLYTLQDELGVENITYTGWQDDPFSFYQSADVAILPSVSRETLSTPTLNYEVRGNEGFPRCHLEAMSFGLPIVGTDIAGVREQVLDGQTGYVVPPSDPEALATALEALLADPARRKEMGAAGRDRVGQIFSTPAYVEGVLRLYAEQVAGTAALVQDAPLPVGSGVS